MSIVIEHLNYVYMQGGPYETRALDDVSLTIHDGEFIGLIGHTGSGKSTLVQHLNGLILPTSGKITVESPMSYRKGDVSMGLPGFDEYTLWRTDPENLRAARKELME